VADLAAWPDVHYVLPLLFADLCDNVQGPLRPPNYQDNLPLVLVRRLGGNDDRITDTARVDVEVYVHRDPELGGGYDAAIALATAIQQRLLNRPHITESGNVDWVETESSPAEIPHDDQAVRLVAATYRISFRR
jgi:hypothetical protein